LKESFRVRLRDCGRSAEGEGVRPRIMPRPLRVEYEGARYHVLSRGDRREDIVLDDGDRERFVKTLGEAAVYAGWHDDLFGSRSAGFNQREFETLRFECLC
jgi:hypothetical protein